LGEVILILLHTPGDGFLSNNVSLVTQAEKWNVLEMLKVSKISSKRISPCICSA